jgi:hypothetical protein
MSFDAVARRLSARVGGPLGFLIALSVAVRRIKRWRAQRPAETQTQVGAPRGSGHTSRHPAR